MAGIDKYKNTIDSVQATRALDPSYFLPDERGFSDFLKFVNRLSRRLRFYNLDNEPEGTWYDFFISDEVFLLAEIDAFPLEEVEKKRIAILISFENQGTAAGKYRLIGELFAIIRNLLRTLDDWYRLSSRYNRNRESTRLELELTSAIEYTAEGVFQKMRAIHAGTRRPDGTELEAWDESELAGLWNRSSPFNPVDLFGGADTPEALSIALKQLMLILKPLYNTYSLLVVRARRLLTQSLEENSAHRPHIGLFLTFLQLFRYVQEDINRIPERQLRFYFEDILGQRRRPRVPDRMLLHFTLDGMGDGVTVPRGTIVLAGQNAEGVDKRYALEREVRLGRAQLARIATLFVSRNPQIDQNSRFQMVSGIYARSIDPASETSEPWSALGEEQRFLTSNERTMSDADTGFVVASPTLRLQGGERRVELVFQFTESSFHYLTTVLMDISNFRKVKPDEVFHAVFSGSVTIEYTGEQGWVPVTDFTFVPPAAWDERVFSIRFTLEKGAPPFVAYQEEVHLAEIGIRQPALRVRLSGSNAYHPYSHLQFLEMEELEIRVAVSDLRKLALHNSTGPLDDSGPFELLGGSPRKGSFLLIGNDELFCKQIDSLQVGWDFHALPLDDTGLKGYFAAYPDLIGNDSFRLRVSALSRHRFVPKEDDPAQVVPLFESDGDEGPVRNHRFLESVDLAPLKIRYRHQLQPEDLEEYNSRKELGYLKFELVSPSIGFGYEVYSDVYNRSISESADIENLKRGSRLQVQAPRDPFTPMAENVFVNYTASTKMVFAATRSFNNNASVPNTYVHLHPFGRHTVFHAGRIDGKRMVPHFQSEGSLFIGIADIRPQETVNLLFELERNDKWTFGKGPELEWSYLTNNEWKPFRPEKILFDDTNGLINSGIISFEMPDDISLRNAVMEPGLCWISVGAAQKAELVSRIRRIHINAASAVYLDDDRDPDHPVSLPANSVSSLEEEIPGVLSVQQPLPTVDGRLAETQASFNLRVSEILRHKNRAITSWDIEKMLLRRFDWLSVVKSYGHMGNEDHVRVGQIVVVALPRINPSSVFYQPLLNPGQLHRMEEYLQQVSSPFADIRVRNPTYEYIWFKCKIRLNSTEIGATLKTLYQDMLRYICPWFYGDPLSAMGGRQFKKSEILSFIQNRPYIAFVTGFSIIHMRIDDDGKYQLQDSARNDTLDEIVHGNPWSILVPFASNNIEIIHDNNYHPPEVTSIEDLMIGSNLIVGGEFKPREPAERPRNLLPAEQQVQKEEFWFSLKI